jgi:uncharacterized protein YodC (DUF2158 family)
VTIVAFVEKREPKFAPGDIVYLKSGGPKMTVSGADMQVEPGWVNVEWFVDEFVQRDAFDEACLQK